MHIKNEANADEVNIRPVIDFLSAYVKVSATEMESMRCEMHFSSFGKNDVIQKQGEIPKSVFFILKGAVRTYYTDEEGNEQTVNFILENQPFVPFESFAQQTPSALAMMAMENTDIIYIRRDGFFGFLETFPKYETVLRNIISQIVVLESEYSKLLRINPARGRYEVLCKSRPDIITRVPLKYIASYLGMTLETLSRIRAGKL
jgi:CRP-like cAMP-binding protein